MMLKGLRVIVVLLLTVTRINAQQITYNRNVKPILEARCVTCHSKGCVGAMPLANYKEASAYGEMIKLVTTIQRMPPWKADAHYSMLANVHPLSPTEIATITAWVDSGVKEGLPVKALKEKALLKVPLKATHIFAMKQRFTPKQVHNGYPQVFVIPTDLDSDLYVDAFEFVPGNKRIVQSCFISIDTSSEGEKFDSYDLKYGYTNFGAYAFIPSSFMWGQWTPEDRIATMPAGFVKKIPAHSKLLFYVNYLPVFSINPESDSSYLKVRAVKSLAGNKLIQSRILIDTSNLLTPPFIINRDDRKQCLAALKLNRATTIHSVMPMGQYICKSWEVYALNPANQQQIPLLSIPDWDFNWRKKYELSAPVTIPAGYELRALAAYDNTENNANLPILPSQVAHYGESKRNEMFTVSFDVSY